MPEFVARYDLTPRRGRKKPLPLRVRHYFKEMARQIAIQYHIKPEIFVSMINQESGFDPRRISKDGARGIAQIMHNWHPNADTDHPIPAMRYAANHIANLVKQYRGNYNIALSIYNSGRPNAYKWPWFAKGQTYWYVININAMAAVEKARMDQLALADVRRAG